MRQNVAADIADRAQEAVKKPKNRTTKSRSCAFSVHIACLSALGGASIDKGGYQLQSVWTASMATKSEVSWRPAFCALTRSNVPCDGWRSQKAALSVPCYISASLMCVMRSLLVVRASHYASHVRRRLSEECQLAESPGRSSLAHILDFVLPWQKRFVFLAWSRGYNDSG
jgi:hypothetical protein